MILYHVMGVRVRNLLERGEDDTASNNVIWEIRIDRWIDRYA